MDVQGAAVVRPYAEKFNVTFPVAVDAADVFGRAFGLKAIPVSFFVDEVGIIRLQGSGPKAEFRAQLEQLLNEPLSAVRAEPPQLPAARSRTELERRVADEPQDWQARLALARLYEMEQDIGSALKQLTAAAAAQPREAGVHFLWGQVLLRQGDKAAALAKLRHARELDPDNWRIRKQIWAIEHPEKFYSGDSPDFAWQKEELAREKRAGR